MYAAVSIQQCYLLCIISSICPVVVHIYSVVLRAVVPYSGAIFTGANFRENARMLLILIFAFFIFGSARIIIDHANSKN